ncbi:hypothetical protein AAHB63_00105 [Bacillus thuringiensis]
MPYIGLLPTLGNPILEGIVISIFMITAISAFNVSKKLENAHFMFPSMDGSSQYCSFSKRSSGC